MGGQPPAPVLWPAVSTAPWGYFECGHCGEKYARGWPPADAAAEHERIFGFREDQIVDEVIEVCDACHQALLAWWQALPAAERDAMERQARGL